MPWFKGESSEISKKDIKETSKKDLSKGEPRSPKAKKQRRALPSDVDAKRKASKHDRKPSRDKSKKSLSGSDKSRSSSRVKVIKKNPRPTTAYQTAAQVRKRAEGAKGRADAQTDRVEVPKSRPEIPKRQSKSPKSRVELEKKTAEAKKQIVDPQKARILISKARPQIAGQVEVAKNNPATIKKENERKSPTELLKNRAESLRVFRGDKNHPQSTKDRDEDVQSRSESPNNRRSLFNRFGATRGRDVYQALVDSHRKDYNSKVEPDLVEKSSPSKKWRLFPLKSQIEKDPLTTVDIKRGRSKKKSVIPIDVPKKSQSRTKRFVKRQIWRISKPALKNSSYWSNLFEENSIDIDKIKIDAVDLSLIDVDALGIENKMVKRTVTWLLK